MIDFILKILKYMIIILLLMSYLTQPIIKINNLLLKYLFQISIKSDLKIIIYIMELEFIKIIT